MIAWKRLSRLYAFSEDKLFIALAFLIGLFTGVSAWFFIRSMEWFQFWPAIPGQSHFLHWTLGRFGIVLIPALGGLLCGLVIQFFAPTAGGNRNGGFDVCAAPQRGPCVVAAYRG